MDNPVIDKYGDKYWYQHGKRHRDDGPAIEHADGNKYWYQHGKRHRDDGPAVIWAHGDKEWFQHGKIHRDDGPAIEDANGDKYWWLADERFTFDEWLNRTTGLTDEDKVMMKLRYG
jgi:hypothetical protein